MPVLISIAEPCNLLCSAMTPSMTSQADVLAERGCALNQFRREDAAADGGPDW